MLLKLECFCWCAFLDVCVSVYWYILWVAHIRICTVIAAILKWYKISTKEVWFCCVHSNTLQGFLNEQWNRKYELLYYLNDRHFKTPCQTLTSCSCSKPFCFTLGWNRFSRFGEHSRTVRQTDLQINGHFVRFIDLNSSAILS